MSMKRRALSVLLTLAVMFTFMPLVSQQAYAASKSPVQVVTKAKANDGNTTYTYNKKGLVSKSVTKTFSKGSDYDESVTDTVTYKYNKKNKVSKKTEKVVTKNTSYNTDKTTGKNITGTKGTVTTTDTYVTTYKYNKKGLATQSVVTRTTTKSGSTTETYTNRRIGYYDEDYYGAKELTDGRIIAGYNERDAAGKYVEENTAANAYYYTGAVNDAVRNGTITYTYKDNGNGSYTVISDDASASTNYSTQADRKYYYFKEDGSVAECTEDEYYDYDYDERFTITNAVVVTIDPSKNYSYANHEENTYQNSSVTTTKYTYKKGRVSKAVATTVNTSVNTDGVRIETNTDSEGTRTDVYNSADTSTSVDTNTDTTVYTYKNGRVSKAVVTDNGVQNHVETTVNALPNHTWTEADGKTGSRVGSGADCESVTKVEIANGTKTVTYTPFKYMETYTRSDGTTDTYVVNEEAKPTVNTSVVKATPSKDTYKYTYDKNGNLKKYVRTGSASEEVTLKNETFGNALFEFGADGKAIAATTVISNSSKYTANRDTTVKNGTKRLNKVLYMGSGTYGRTSSSGYGLNGRVVYTLKAKKLSSKLAKAAEQQQWVLQNGALNGQVGLF